MRERERGRERESVCGREEDRMGEWVRGRVNSKAAVISPSEDRVWSWIVTSRVSATNGRDSKGRNYRNGPRAWKNMAPPSS